MTTQGVVVSRKLKAVYRWWVTPATKDSIFAWVHEDHKLFANESDESLSFSYICYITYKGYKTKVEPLPKQLLVRKPL